jgi:cytidyltransferase-like protein
MESSFGPKKVVAVSGYFDPLHEGHIEFFKLAKKLGDKLVVILNNDVQVGMKKGRAFMSEEGRKAVLEGLSMVDEVFVSVDEDVSVCESIKLIRPDIFANGGDRFSHEIPESKVCKDLGIEIVDNLGKKVQSSSSLISESRKSYVERCWGKFVSIEKGDGYQVKRLTVDPQKRISLQKHLHRSEHWIVVGGVAKVVLDDREIFLYKNESVYVPIGAVHRLENIGKIPLEIIEVQVGEYLKEDDIVRFEDDFGRVEEFCVGPDCDVLVEE